MTFAAPLALGIAAAAAIATIALHFIATRRPTPTPLPTARFIDDLTARAVSRAVQLSDAWLLLLRVVALLVLGAGFAGPRPEQSARARRIWLVDRSRAVGSMDEVRRVTPATGSDIVVLFDSVARLAAAGSLSTVQRSGVRGSLSAAFASALREAARADVRAESLAVHVVSPSAIEEVDSATALLVASVRGRVQWVRVAPAIVRSAERRTVHSVGAADSAWMGEGDRVLVLWPSDSAPIAAHAVSTEGTAFVALLGRRPVGEGAALARWEDGAPAVVERTLGRGCLREVGVRTPFAGDVQLGTAWRAFDAALGAPCGSPRFEVDSAWTRPARSVAPLAVRVSSVSPWAPWLLALGALLLAAELFARRRRGT